MLTATYALTAMTAEQSALQRRLLTFQQFVRANIQLRSELKPGQLDYLRDSLSKLYRACQWRKLDMYLTPALRKLGALADNLLDALAGLSRRAAAASVAVQSRLRAAKVNTAQQVLQICEQVEVFCEALLRRLEREQEELLPLARISLSGEVWFDVANQILLHEAQAEEARRGAAPRHLPPACRTELVAAPLA